MTLPQAAMKMGVSPGSVHRWETGKVKPSPMAREKIEAYIAGSTSAIKRP